MFKWIKKIIKSYKDYLKEHEGDFIGPDSGWWRS